MTGELQFRSDPEGKVSLSSGGGWTERIALADDLLAQIREASGSALSEAFRSVATYDGETLTFEVANGKGVYRRVGERWTEQGFSWVDFDLVSGELH